MALEKPDRLDAPYVQKVLRNAERDESIEVFEMTVKPATAKGDNYTSDMHRVSVKYSGGQIDCRNHNIRSVIVKVAPYDRREEWVAIQTSSIAILSKRLRLLTITNFTTQIATMGVFEIEASMMSVTLPKMQEILGSHSMQYLGARCLYHQLEKPTHIVIEDLTPKGFKMAQHRLGLDLNHSVLAIRNLARFHASSIALREKDMKAIAKYKKGPFHKDNPVEIKMWVNRVLRSLANETTRWSELNPRIPEKLHKLSDMMFEKACEAALYREDDFNVLNHGDMWMNNMMFRYNEEQKPIDQIFVDFQICHWGSPAEDLLRFFGSSLSDDVRVQHRDLLTREYHTTLSNTMFKLKCKTVVLSYDNLQAVLKKRVLYEVFATAATLPTVVFEEGESFNLEDALKTGVEFHHPGHCGKTYRKIMTRLLPLYDSIGSLDV